MVVYVCRQNCVFDGLVPRRCVVGVGDCGVSKIIIRVPESAGCRIKSDAALSKKDFPGFEKTSDGVFDTTNFGDSEQSVVIDLSCALSDVIVRRY